MPTPPPLLCLPCALLLASCVIPKPITISSTPPGPRTFPEMQAKNLADETKVFPKDFPGERTLLLIAFEREQQEILDNWSAHLSLQKPGAPEWLELPVINDPGGFARWFIDSGMKSGIPDPAVRARVFTLYTPREDFVRRLGLPDSTQVHVAVADRQGRIFTHVTGNWTKGKEKQLRRALP